VVKGFVRTVVVAGTLLIVSFGEKSIMIPILNGFDNTFSHEKKIPQ